MGDWVADLVGYPIDWTLTWSMVTALTTAGLLLGAALSAYLVYRGHRHDQLYRLAEEHERRGFADRFSLVHVVARDHELVTALQRVYIVLPTKGGGYREVTHFAASEAPEKGWSEAMRDAVLNLFGPAYSTDGLRSDLGAFAVLVSRLTFWTGASNRLKQPLLAGRVRQLLRVFGAPLLRAMTEHIRLVSKTGSAVIVHVEDETMTATVKCPFYLESFGLKDEAFIRLARALVSEASSGEFKTGMASAAKALGEALDAIPSDAAEFEMAL